MREAHVDNNFTATILDGWEMESLTSAGPVALHLMVSVSTAESKLNGKSLPGFCSARIIIQPVKA
jgi:hypothetical protein